MHLRLADDNPWPLDRPRIMGVLNVTPDSFSDGGKFAECDAAVAHAKQMVADGADIIDIGGESTRPGADRVEAHEQIRRTRPIIAALHEWRASSNKTFLMSIDTTRGAVAAAAVEAGADMINDVSAGLDDDGMLSLAATLEVPMVLMHMKGQPATMQHDPQYDDVVEDIAGHLVERANAALTAGIAKGRIAIDPGIGFGKTLEHNLTLLANLEAFVALGYPVLLGCSRKKFIRVICGIDHAASSGFAHEAIGGTCATTAIGVAAGVHMFRVHDVKDNRHAADVAARIWKHR